MTDKKQPQSKPFNVVLGELLHDPKNKGVFIGERHIHPSLRQSIIYLLPMIKAKGVTTLSVELSQEMVDHMISAKSTEAWTGSKEAQVIPDNYYRADYCDLMRKANAMGIKVLGHEDPDIGTKSLREIAKLNEKVFGDRILELARIKDDKVREKAIYQMIKEEVEKNESYRNRLAECLPDSAASVMNRNIFAAGYIEKNKSQDGKVLVLGGAAHSQQLGTLERPDGKEKEGLDKRLGIPAINTVNTSTLFVVHGGRAGATETVSPNKIYQTLLPADLKTFLKNRKITSWPPVDGLPNFTPYEFPPVPALPASTPSVSAPRR